LVLALDADFAGSETTKRAITDAELLDFDIMVAVYEQGKDPDEAIKKDPIKFKDVLKKPIPIYDFIINTSVAKYESLDAFAKKEITDTIIPFIINIENPIVKSHYVKKIADILSVDQSSVETAINKYLRREKLKKASSFAVKAAEKSRFDMLQQYLLSLVIQHKNPPQMTRKLLKIMKLTDFTIVAYQKIISSLSEIEDAGEFKYENYVKNLSPQLKQVCDELYLFDITIFDKTISEENWERILYEFKRLSLKKQIKECLENSTETKSGDMKKMAAELSAIEKRLTVM
jgi:DNA primase